MNKLFLLCLAALLIPFNSVAQESLAGTFSAGLNAYGPVGTHDKTETNWGTDVTPYMNYWGIAAEGAYRLKLYDKFQFHPAVSFYYENHKPVGTWLTDGDSPIATERGHLSELGFEVALPFGFGFPIKAGVIEVETGPVVGLYVYQRAKCYWEDIKDPFNRFKARWRFAVQYNFCHNKLYAKMAFDLSMTDYTDSYLMNGTEKHYRCRNVLSGGVGWNF